MYRSMQPQMILDVSGVKSYPVALVTPVKNHLKNYLYMGKIKKYPIYKDDMVIGYEAPEKQIKIIICEKN